MNKHILAITFLALVGAACGPSTETDLESAFCAALSAPAARTVTAADTAAGAPDVTDVARVDITLAGTTGEHRGVVTYQPDEAGRFVFGLTEDVGLVVKDSAGAEVPIETSVTGAAACTQLAVRYTIQMKPGTYTLDIGPAESSTIGIVAEESDDDL